MEIKPKHDLIKRSTQYNAEKQQVALKAIEFISENDIIGIDSGSTAFIFAEALKEHFSSLTVITPSLDVFQIIMSIEEEFDIEIENEDAEKIVSVGDAVEQIKSALN